MYNLVTRIISLVLWTQMMFYAKWTPLESPWGTKLSFPGSKVGFSVTGDQNTMTLCPFWSILFVSTLPSVCLHCAEDAHFVHCWSGVHIWCLPKAGTLEADTLSLFPGSKFTRPSLRMFVRTMETLFPSLVFANRCLPLWHRTTNLWSNGGGTHTETPVTWEGNTPIRLFPRCSAVTECDNYPFSFPIQPPGDGRFSILSPTLNLRNFSLWLLTSTGGWKKAKLL